jgi:hypothetical protein
VTDRIAIIVAQSPGENYIPTSRNTVTTILLNPQISASEDLALIKTVSGNLHMLWKNSTPVAK